MPNVDPSYQEVFPMLPGQENVACDVDEVLRPDPARRHDAAEE